MYKFQSRLFLVEGYDQVAQTFVRNDFEFINKSNEWKILDIIEYRNVWRSSLKNLLVTLYFLSLLFLSYPRELISILSNRNFKSSVNSLLTFSGIVICHPDIKNIDYSKSHFLGKCAVISYLMFLKYSIDYSIVCHGSDLYSSPSGYNRILLNATEIDCVTSFGKGFVLGRLGKHAIGKVNLKRNKISHPFKTKVSQDCDVQLSAVSICRLVPQKDMQFGLHVIRELAFRNPNIQLNVIGDGPDREILNNLACELDISDKVNFLGSLPNEEALDILSRSDLFILPCLEKNFRDADGLPVVFQESLSFGVPVFTRTSFGVSELIIDGLNGRAFDRDRTCQEWAIEILKDLKTIDSELVLTIFKHQYGSIDNGL